MQVLRFDGGPTAAILDQDFLWVHLNKFLQLGLDHCDVFTKLVILTEALFNDDGLH